MTVQMKGMGGSKNNHLGRSNRLPQETSRGLIKLPVATRMVTLPITIQLSSIPFPLAIVSHSRILVNSCLALIVLGS